MAARGRQPVIHALWRADHTRVAHATVARDARTLCGLWPVREQFSWPARNRCETCTWRFAAMEHELASHA